MTKKALFLHRLFILFIILLLPTFLIREYRILLSKKDYRILPMREFERFELGTAETKRFVCIVITCNAIASIEDNFESILDQNYPDYRIVYLDRGSTDGTLEKLLELREKEPDRVSVLSLPRQSEFFEQYYRVIQECSDEEIIVHLYGSEWLAHKEVLRSFNQVYLNPDVWLTYGQHLSYLDFQKGHYHPLPKKILYRKKVHRAPWIRAQLKTFYAGLFKKIEFRGAEKKNYFFALKDESELLSPLVEMGRAHVQFIPDVLSIHYQPLKPSKKKWYIPPFLLKKKQVILPQDKKRQLVDLMLFTRGDVEKVTTCLKGLLENTSGVRQFHVICPFGKEDRAYLETLFPQVEFASVLPECKGTFKEVVLERLLGRREGAPYVLFATDQSLLNKPLNLEACVLAMQKTGAYGFYLLPKKGEKEKMRSWMIGEEQVGQVGISPVEMALYRKIDLERTFKDIPFTNCETLIELWSREFPRGRLGLSAVF